jgi:hypothetical protein
MLRSKGASRFVLAVALALGCAHSEKALAQEALRWTFQPGRKFYVRLTRSNETMMTGSGIQRNRKDESIADEICCVTSVDNSGTAEITMTIERVQMKNRTPEASVDMDSA